MRSVSSWLLAGALLASLSWNWQLARERAAAPAPIPAAGEGCTLDLSCAGLDPEQEERLGAICARSCAEADDLEREADELQAELLASLAAPSVDRATTERLVGEVGELRRRSLAACVEGILGVREVLAPDDVRALLSCCEQGPAEAACSEEE